MGESLDMYCHNASCSDLELHCPFGSGGDSGDSKQCRLSGQGDVHSRFSIFAFDSWYDIDLTNYTATLDDGGGLYGNDTSYMFCGSDLDDFCEMTNTPEFVGNWNCI